MVLQRERHRVPEFISSKLYTGRVIGSEYRPTRTIGRIVVGPRQIGTVSTHSVLLLLITMVAGGKLSIASLNLILLVIDVVVIVT